MELQLDRHLHIRCTCPRAHENDRLIPKATGEYEQREVDGQMKRVPVLGTTMVSGGVPFISMREVERLDDGTLRLSGTCHRCSEVVTADVLMTELGLREDAPAPHTHEETASDTD